MVAPDALRRRAAAARRPAHRRSSRPRWPSSTSATRTRSARSGWSTSTTCSGPASRALESDRDFAAAQRWRFRHLFVDEFQDVNPLQFRLLDAWRGDRPTSASSAIPTRRSTGGTAPTRATSSTSAAASPAPTIVALERQLPLDAPDPRDRQPRARRAARCRACGSRATRPDGPIPDRALVRDRRPHEARAIARGAARPPRPRRAVVAPGGAGAHQRAGRPARRGAAGPSACRCACGARPPFLAAARGTRGARALQRGRGSARRRSSRALDRARRPPRARRRRRADDAARRRAGARCRNLEELLRLAGRVRGRRPRRPPSAGFAAWLAATVGARRRRREPATRSTSPRSTPPRASSGRSCTSPASRTGSCRSATPARERGRRPRSAGCSTSRVTRAERELRLTWAESARSATRSARRRPSPYLDELEPRARRTRRRHRARRRRTPAPGRPRRPSAPHAAAGRETSHASALDRRTSALFEELRTWRPAGEGGQRARLRHLRRQDARPRSPPRQPTARRSALGRSGHRAGEGEPVRRRRARRSSAVTTRRHAVRVKQRISAQVDAAGAPRTPTRAATSSAISCRSSWPSRRGLAVPRRSTPTSIALPKTGRHRRGRRRRPAEPRDRIASSHLFDARRSLSSAAGRSLARYGLDGSPTAGTIRAHPARARSAARVPTLRTALGRRPGRSCASPNVG